MTAIPPRESRGALTPKLKTDGVVLEAVSVSPCGSSHLRHGDFEGEAKSQAVCPPALFAGGVAGATADQAERLGSLMEADAIPTDVAELAAVWYRLPDAAGQGSWPWCGPREGDAGVGDERSGTVPRFDRQSSSPLAGLNLFAGPSSAWEEPFPAAAARIGFPSVAQLNPISNRFLDGNERFPRLDPKRGDVPSPERSSKEKSSEPAKHQKTSPRFYTAHGD